MEKKALESKAKKPRVNYPKNPLHGMTFFTNEFLYIYNKDGTKRKWEKHEYKKLDPLRMRTLLGMKVDIPNITIPIKNEYKRYPPPPDDSIVELIEKYWERFNMQKYAYGISAPQLGLPYHICYINNPKVGKYIIINGKLTKEEDIFTYLHEVNLTYPERLHHTLRFKSIRVKHSTGTDNFYGTPAVVVQHLLDHCNQVPWHTRFTNQVIAGKTIGRNDPCPCGSKKKFKRCCGSVLK